MDVEVNIYNCVHILVTLLFVDCMASQRLFDTWTSYMMHIKDKHYTLMKSILYSDIAVKIESNGITIFDSPLLFIPINKLSKAERDICQYMRKNKMHIFKRLEIYDMNHFIVMSQTKISYQIPMKTRIHIIKMYFIYAIRNKTDSLELMSIYHKLLNRRIASVDLNNFLCFGMNVIANVLKKDEQNQQLKLLGQGLCVQQITNGESSAYQEPLEDRMGLLKNI